MKTTRTVWADVDIRGGEAVWVLSAHLYALAVPIAVCVAVYRHWAYLVSTTDMPSLFFVGACLMSAGAAFEVAQNTIDRWYLTEDTASANGRGLCDLLFYLLIVAAQGVTAVAIGGDNPWVVGIAVASVLSLPPLYLAGGPYFASLGVVTVLVMALAFRAFGDPVVFLQILLVAATLYFFTALLATKAQALHGFTTLAASSGAWFLIWSFADGSTGQHSSWLLPIAVTVAAATLGLALWPWLNRLPVSRRAPVLGV